MSTDTICPGSHRPVPEGAPPAFGVRCPVCAYDAFQYGPYGERPAVDEHPLRPLPPIGCRFLHRDHPGLWTVRGHYSDGTALRATSIEGDTLDITLHDVVLYCAPGKHDPSWPNYGTA